MWVKIKLMFPGLSDEYYHPHFSRLKTKAREPISSLFPAKRLCTTNELNLKGSVQLGLFKSIIFNSWNNGYIVLSSLCTVHLERHTFPRMCACWLTKRPLQSFLLVALPIWLFLQWISSQQSLVQPSVHSGSGNLPSSVQCFSVVLLCKATVEKS